MGKVFIFRKIFSSKNKNQKQSKSGFISYRNCADNHTCSIILLCMVGTFIVI